MCGCMSWLIRHVQNAHLKQIVSLSNVNHDVSNRHVRVADTEYSRHSPNVDADTGFYVSLGLLKLYHL